MLMQRGNGIPAYDWAVRFHEKVRAALTAREHRTLIDYALMGEDARLSVPTPEHYLPLLYIAALQDSDEAMHFAVDGYEGGSLSMLTAVAGGGAA